MNTSHCSAVATFCIVMGAISIPSPSFAADLHVPGAFPTVQSAIDAAVDGDAVIVAPGIYPETIDFDGKAITVRSVDPDDDGVVAATILDGHGLGASVVTFDSDEESSSMLIGLTVTGGPAQFGGGIRCAGASPTIQQCVIIDNEAMEYGGGVYALFADPLIDRCRLIANNAERGGGCFAFEGSITMVNTVVARSTATLGGGGADFFNTTVAMTNCTFGDNVSTQSTPSLRIQGQCQGAVHNSIFTGGPAPHIGGGSSLPAFAHCIIEGGYAGQAIHDVEPLFLDKNGQDNIFGTADDNYRLNRFSAGVDAGWNEAPGLATITMDLGGSPRFYDDLGVSDEGVGKGSLVDIGAYERQAESAVRSLTVTPEDGLQNAIDESIDGDDIVLDPGIYLESINVFQKNIQLRSSDPNDPDVVASTIIDGNLSSSSVVQFNDCANAAIEGVTIRGGDHQGFGGGLNIALSCVTVSNCVFRDNHARGGGGLYLNGFTSNCTISGCWFEDNSATEDGGGAMLTYGNATRTSDCTFHNNAAGRFGGGIAATITSTRVFRSTFTENTALEGGAAFGSRLLQCDIRINSALEHGGGASGGALVNCVVENNAALLNGGGAYFVDQITNTLIANNTSEGDGGGIYGSGTVSNSTVAGNQANGNGIAVCGASPEQLVITNTIVWGSGQTSIFHYDVAPSVTFSNIEGGYAGEGNISAHPMFVDSTNGNHRLLPDSPCIDAGLNDGIAADDFDIDNDGDFNEANPLDLDELNRVADGDDDGDARVDIGAYELHMEFCTGDVNGDCIVNIDDLLQLLADWGACDGCAADLNDDGDVDVDDLLILLGAWSG